MFLEISEGRRVKPALEIYRAGDLLPYTLRGTVYPSPGVTNVSKHDKTDMHSNTLL
jgi:hypothetical protein